MEEFKKSLHEIYMNYDTVQYLKEDNQTKDDIVDMFNDELDYSKELTSNLLKYDKTFLKSIAMRIKLKMKRNVENEKIKKEILSYDNALQPLLEKLLVTNEFKKQYEAVTESAEKLESAHEEGEGEEEESVQYESDVEVDEENTNSVEQFISSDVEKTEDSSDFIKVSELYKHYCSYCEGENLEEISKSDFKKYLASKWGKSVKSGYTGYRMLEEE